MRTFTKEELRDILQKHQDWLLGKENGVRANLSCADLSSANLSSANLSYANLSSANLSYADLSSANLRYADLRSANLRYANLSSANLSYANYSDIYEDFMAKLALQKNEVVGLLKAVIDGKVDGSTYTGDCACFVGTIANVAATDYTKLKVQADASSPTERFFTAIRKGDTPENNQVSEIVTDWIIEFLMINDMDIPHREVIWS